MLFERETALYREVVARIGSQPGNYKELPELLRFVAARTEQALSLRRVKIIVLDDQEEGHPEWVDQLLVSFQNNQSSVLENDPTLREEGFQLGYALQREDKTYGVRKSYKSLTIALLTCLQLPITTIAVAFLILLDGGLARPE